jgi:hypothetical protein
MKEGQDAVLFARKVPSFAGKASSFAGKSPSSAATVESRRCCACRRPVLVMHALERDRAATWAGAGLHHLVNFYIN